MKKKYWISTLLFAAMAALSFSDGLDAKTRAVRYWEQDSTQPPLPKQISAKELIQLRWIEGSWRGTGDNQAPFFERYHFEGDSTLVVETFADGTLNKVNEVTRFQLKDMQFGNGGEGARWIVTHMDAESVRFEPVAVARNTFVWKRETKDIWKAILIWPGKGDKPSSERIYKMERWTPTKQ